MYEEFLTIEENTKDWSVRNKKGNTGIRITNKSGDSSDKSFEGQWKSSDGMQTRRNHRPSIEFSPMII